MSSPTQPGRHILAAPAWPYANGPRHIGHVSGFGVPSDVFSRYQRMVGNRVLMVSGTDEHGTPIQVQADAEGTTPRELVDRYSRVIQDDLVGLGLSYDLFTRTSTDNHHRVVQDLFTALHHNGYVFGEKTLGAISPSTGRTLPDDLAGRPVFVLDPMLATGGSMAHTIDLLSARRADDVTAVCVVAAPEGLSRLGRDHPAVRIVTAAVDERLNEVGYIVPGLGDAGDRQFGAM